MYIMYMSLIKVIGTPQTSDFVYTSIFSHFKTDALVLQILNKVPLIIISTLTVLRGVTRGSLGILFSHGSKIFIYLYRYLLKSLQPVWSWRSNKHTHLAFVFIMVVWSPCYCVPYISMYGHKHFVWTIFLLIY